MIEGKPIHVDVLVIGGGGAGAMAAIWASKEVFTVGLVEKGIFGKSGCTVMGAFSICAALPGNDSPDDPRIHMEDTIRAGHFLNQQELVKVFAYEAPERVEELISYGARFEQENKKLKKAKIAGHTHPRGYFHNRRTGPMIMGTLAKEVKRIPKIHLFEEVRIIDMIIDGEGPHYAIGIRWADSTLMIFQAKTIIVATGGGCQIFRNSTTPIDNSGDGLSLLFHAGAELADLEFVQFYPTATCFPKFPGLGPTAPSYLGIRPGGKIYNALGEEFLDKKMPGWRFRTTRDMLAQAIYKEIMEGRGSPHGGVYTDVAYFPQEMIKEKYGLGGYYHRLCEMEGDPAKRQIETTVAAHYFMGGARVNVKGETNVPGLYAAGEAAAGYHGANRLAGNALAEILVSGSRAGRFAAQRARAVSEKGTEDRELPMRLMAIGNMITRWGNRAQGIRPVEIKTHIRDLMWERAGVIREGRKMKEGLDQLAELKDKAENQMSIFPGRRYNRELLDAFDSLNMIRVSHLILRAALIREESRGAHYREDFPFPDNTKWLANINLKKFGKGVNVKIEKVQLTYLCPTDHE